jgi:hypothetical protein
MNDDDIKEYIKSSVASYITNMSAGDLAKKVAVGQDDNYNFGKTWRWPKLTDIAGTKWSAAIISLSAGGLSESVFAQTTTIAALKGGISPMSVHNEIVKKEAALAAANETLSKSKIRAIAIGKGLFLN